MGRRIEGREEGWVSSIIYLHSDSFCLSDACVFFSHTVSNFLLLLLFLLFLISVP